MKRNERNTMNRLRRSVNGNTICVEIPESFSHEARQAIHEMLTIEKGFYAVRINWNNINNEYCVHYAPAGCVHPATRIRQELEDVDHISTYLRRSDYTWNGYHK